MAGPDPSTVEWVPIWSAVTEGPVGPAGPPGAQGPPGLSTSVFYFKADATATAESDPGSGKMRWNAIPQTDATMLYFDRLTDDGFDIIALLQQTTFGTHFTIQDADLSANSQTWKQLSPGFVMGGDWFEVEVEFVSQTGSGTMQNNQRVAVLLDTMVGPHAYTHEPGGDDPITALDADVLTTGLLADARLSSNVPRLDQANVFTQPNTFDAITATVVTASGLSTTPLHASNLTTGTVPDARLSGNVQMKPVALTDLPATVATLPIAQSNVTGLVSDLATLTTGLATKAPLDSPVLTGVPTAPTASVGTATAQLATTAFVSSYLTATGYVTGPVSAVVNNLAAFNATNGARIADSTIPATAVARKDQSNVFTAAVTFQVGPTAPTAAPGTNTTQVATTAFVVSTIATSTATPAAHHASHETGGSDALAALSASILTTGTVANARLTVDVLRVTGGYPGGTTTFLRADGTFAVASGAVTAHHATHEPGGSDALVGAAWVASQNTFTANQTISKTTPGLFFQETAQVANSKLWELYVNGTAFYIASLTDAGSSIAGFGMDRAGNVALSGNQTIRTYQPALDFYDTDALPADSHAYRIVNKTNGTLRFQAMNDALTVGTVALMLDRASNATFYGNVSIAGSNSSIIGANPTGPMQLLIQNTAAGAAARTTLLLGNDAVPYLTNLQSTSSTWTPGSYAGSVTNDTQLIAFGNGMALVTIAAAPIRFATANVDRMTITGAGSTTFTGQVQVSALNPSLKFGGATSAFPALRNSGNILDVTTADTPASLYAPLRAGYFLSAYAGTNLADLTVSGGMSVGGATLLSGDIDCTGGSGTGYSTAPIEVRMSSSPRVSFHWPGVVASQIGMDSAGTIRTYDNPGTGYASFACQNIVTATSGSNLVDLTCGNTNFTVGLTVTGGQASTFAGPIYGSQYIYTVGVMYPGRIDNGAAQLSWYIAGHGSYGLYTNAGLGLGGGIWCAALSCTSISCSGATSLATSLALGGGPSPIATQMMINNISTNSSIVTRCTDNGSYNAMTFLNAGNGGCGNIYVNVGGNTIYATGSDERLKTDRGRATDVTALRQVIIHAFDWRRDGSRDIGLFAQEAYALFPSAILPGLDDRTDSGELVKPWAIDYSKLVPHLIVGWQQHEAEIAALKAELTRRRRS